MYERRVFLRWLLVLALSMLSHFPVCSQEKEEYVETAISLNVAQIGGKEMPAVLSGETLYLPILDLFAFLRIQCHLSASMDSAYGQFMSDKDAFLLDRKNRFIRYRDKVYTLEENDLVRTEDNLYLKSTFFGAIFGLECKFDFRYLRMNLITKLELPAIKEMRLEFMRRNLNNLKGDIKADTNIPRSYPLFHFGNADWSVIATQRAPGGSDVRVSLGLGSIIAGGEANVILNYSSNSPFREEQQIYHWHFANNNRKWLRQVILGKIPTQAMSSIYTPVVGVVATNTPTTYRRSFGSYTLSDYTEPNWTVELYVNYVMVDFTKADASGFFLFDVPMVYGNSVVTLKFYGPWGEERSKEKNISVPYNFLPPRTFEYTIGGGFLEDSVMNRFGRVSLNYGVSPILTLSTGVEHNSSIHPGSTMPFVRFALRAASSLLITGEYTFGVRFRGILNYRFRSNLQLELSYVKFHPEQMAITNNYLEERRLTMTLPVNKRRMSILMRFMLNNSIAASNQFINSELLLSCNFQGVSANFTTNLNSTNYQLPYAYSTLSIGFKLPKGFLVTPQTQFEYNRTRFVSAKVELEKHFLGNATCRIIYEQNFWANVQSVQVGLRYDFPFAQVGASARYSTNQSTFIQSAKGSTIVDRKNKYLGTYNRSNLGKGGLVIIPFFDLNGNGTFDKGEPKTPNLNFKMSGGRIEQKKRDSTYRVFDLEPFAEYFIEIEKNSFENIAWQIKNPIISVFIDPNKFKRVEVPVSILSEATGTVYYADSNELIGQRRITVLFFTEMGDLMGATQSEIDGYYSLLAFRPGNYIAMVSPNQLQKLKWKSEPELIPFTMGQSMDGDLVEGIDFILKPLYPDKSPTSVSRDEPEPIEQISENGKDTLPYYIEVDSLYSMEIAEKVRSLLLKNVHLPIEVVERNGYYFVKVLGILNREEGEQILVRLKELGMENSTIKRNQ
jgi:hypothetical protein